MKSWLEYCDLLPEQSKNPVILEHPSKSKLSELLINDCHLSGHHSGPDYTRRTHRNRYWIVGGKGQFNPFYINVRKKDVDP